MLAFSQAGSSTSRSNGLVGHLGVTQCVNHILLDQHFLTDGAVLAFSQAGSSTSRSNGLVGHLGVTQCVNHILLDQHFLTDGAVLAFSQAGFSTSRIDCLVGHFGVTQFRNHFLIGIATLGASVNSLAGLGAGSIGHIFVVSVSAGIAAHFLGHKHHTGLRNDLGRELQILQILSADQFNSKHLAVLSAGRLVGIQEAGQMAVMINKILSTSAIALLPGHMGLDGNAGGGATNIKQLMRSCLEQRLEHILGIAGHSLIEAQQLHKAITLSGLDRHLRVVLPQHDTALINDQQTGIFSAVIHQIAVAGHVLCFQSLTVQIQSYVFEHRSDGVLNILFQANGLTGFCFQQSIGKIFILHIRGSVHCHDRSCCIGRIDCSRHDRQHQQHDQNHTQQTFQCVLH